MRGLRLLAVLTGLGALVTCGSASAVLAPEPMVEEAPVAELSAPALALLEAAATAARAQPWTGTERVLSLVSGAPVVTVTTVQHGPGQHSATDVLDARLFSLLADNYDLRVTGTARCVGRLARVVEARRPGQAGGLAGRFWVDAVTGLVLRREVLGADGALMRRSELLDVRLGTTAGLTRSATATLVAPRGERVDEVSLALLEAEGWPVVRSLPGSLDLYDVRWLSDGVLQTAYSDGLSTMSLFVQRGEMAPTASGVIRRVGDGTVWEAPGEPERVVWTGGGFTWTLVSDADPVLVDAVLLSLPHSGRQVAADGMAPRVWRGMSRVGAWLNPFH